MVKPSDREIMQDVVLAEASAWLARLQDPERTSASEAAFREWLAADPAHARAFASVTETWELIPGAAAAQAQSSGCAAAMAPAAPDRLRPGEPRRAVRRRWLPVTLAAGLAFLALGGALAWFLQGDPVYQTAVGEQQAFTLRDGSRITLNTDSRLVVAYRQAERRIRLESGEALFEVARQPDRPFVVQAGDQEVRALGTIFVVRREPDRLAVALIDGEVEVAPRSAPVAARDGKPAVTRLSPGERVTLRANAAPELDRPKVEAVTAWQRGEAMFDNATLYDAARELNRYGGPRVRVLDAAAGELRVSGVFATRDPGEFANAIAQLHGLNVERSEAEIRLGSVSR